MRYAVEQWSPDYGTPVEELGALDAPTAKVDEATECAPGDWEPLPSQISPASSVLFVDGVRRIDARVWMGEGQDFRMGICASCAAGVVRCDGRAQVILAEARRYLIGSGLEGTLRTRHAEFVPFATADDNVETLMNGLAQGLSSLEEETAQRAGQADLVVLDGPLRGRERVPGAIGYIKSHRVPYLSPELVTVVWRLAPSERTPVFFIETSWSRYSWYLKLPHGSGHPWSGVVRCEAPPTLSRYEVVELADLVTATLPSFASEPHKDGRAPQNLYPIKGLEDRLRQRLGDAEFLYRSIRGSSQPA